MQHKVGRGGRWEDIYWSAVVLRWIHLTPVKVSGAEERMIRVLGKVCGACFWPHSRLVPFWAISRGKNLQWGDQGELEAQQGPLPP